MADFQLPILSAKSLSVRKRGNKYPAEIKGKTGGDQNQGVLLVFTGLAGPNYGSEIWLLLSDVKSQITSVEMRWLLTIGHEM